MAPFLALLPDRADSRGDMPDPAECELSCRTNHAGRHAFQVCHIAQAVPLTRMSEEYNQRRKASVIFLQKRSY